jgi:hypothetical protein
MRSRTLAASLLLFAACAAGPKVFDTPEAALQALVAGADDPAVAEEVLGDGGAELLSSGDDVADQADREAVRALVREKVAFEDDGDDYRVVLLGNESWPLPLPLIKDGAGWRFDVEAGRDEILTRRIGRNELRTIATLREAVEAQFEYAAQGRDGNPPAFAARFASSDGKHDGLFWPASDGAPESPLGPLVAEAANEGYALDAAARQEGREPYHGYHFRMLTAQGANATGGARSYVEGGLLRTGFAILAWPATYGNSGVMTFLVNQRGIVYERDLGEDTAGAAAKITTFDPDPSWTPAAN